MELNINIHFTAPGFETAIKELASAISYGSTHIFSSVNSAASQTLTAQNQPVHTEKAQGVPVTAPTSQAAATPTPHAAPTPQATATTAVNQVPVAAPPTYTLEQLQAAGGGLMTTGKLNELRALLNSFHVEALTDLPKEKYGAFATKLRELGAKI